MFLHIGSDCLFQFFQSVLIKTHRASFKGQVCLNFKKRLVIVEILARVQDIGYVPEVVYAKEFHGVSIKEKTATLTHRRVWGIW
jgi:hypothetical protein